MKHETFIEFLASYVRPNVYVELGVYDGSTFKRVRPHVKDWSYGVDIKSIMDEIDLACPRSTVYTMSTEDFSNLWNDDIHEDIDLIFIDADHSKEAVLNDVENFLPWLKEDTGLMLLHDTWPLNKNQTAPGYSGDCFIVTSVLKENHPNLEVLTVPVPYGLTIIRKVGKDWRNG